MARLINPGTGDLLDRLSILSLKLLYGQQAGKETKHFRDERNAVLTKINAADRFTGPVVEAGFELAAVNAALWQAEDELRGYARNAANTNPSIVAECAFRIQSLNDRRAELISLINANTGENLGQEKLT